MAAKSDSASPATAPVKRLVQLAESHGNAFSGKGDHALHSKLNDVVIAACELKRKIAEVRGKVPDDLAAVLETIDAAL